MVLIKLSENGGVSKNFNKRRFKPFVIFIFLMMAGVVIADAELWGRNANQYLFPLSYNDSINITDKTKNSSFAGDVKVFGKLYLKSAVNCQVLNTSPNGRVQCSAITGANGGTVTSVTAGRGLSATTNPITTTGTLSIKENATKVSCSNITGTSGNLCTITQTPNVNPNITQLIRSNLSQSIGLATERTNNISQSVQIQRALNNNGTINVILNYLKKGNTSQSVQIATALANNGTQATLIDSKATGTAFTYYNVTKSEIGSSSATVPVAVMSINLGASKTEMIDCIWMVNSTATIGIRPNITITGSTSRQITATILDSASATLFPCGTNGISRTLFCIPTSSAGVTRHQMFIQSYSVHGAGGGTFNATLLSETGARVTVNPGSFCRVVEK